MAKKLCEDNDLLLDDLDLDISLTSEYSNVQATCIEEKYLISELIFSANLGDGRVEKLPIYITNDRSLITYLTNGIEHIDTIGYGYLLPWCIKVNETPFLNKLQFNAPLLLTVKEIEALSIEETLQDYYIYLIKMLSE